MDDFNAVVGRRVWELRQYLSLTREKLAENADISVQFLSDIENGKKSMSVRTLSKLCHALNVTADSILFGNKEATDAHGIYDMLKTLSPEKLVAAEDILKIFIASHAAHREA